MSRIVPANELDLIQRIISKLLKQGRKLGLSIKQDPDSGEYNFTTDLEADQQILGN